MKHLEPAEKIAPPPPEWGAPPETKVATVYYFDPSGGSSDEPISGGEIKITYWADDDMKERVGEVHGVVS